MIGLKNIATYLPETIKDNMAQAPRLEGVDQAFLEKIGILERAIKAPGEMTSDMCVSAYERLGLAEPGDIDCLIVCTQNGDHRLPHTSAIVHGKLGLKPTCAAFDINLGCSGYVYALSVAKSFMEANGMRRGLLFTADPYSEIIDENDKNTTLLFGDAATVTLLTDDPVFKTQQSVFQTHGNLSESLIAPHDGKLFMDGRGIFNYVMRNAPTVIKETLEKNGLSLESVDRFVLHQASRYVIVNLAKRMRIPAEKVPFAIDHYGNTVSSSIPFLLEPLMAEPEARNLLLCGFGVGLSIAATTLRRI